MSFFDLKMVEFLDKVDSAAPTPGGGTVSAAAIAFGIGLLRMVGNLNVSKKKFRELPDTVREDFQGRLGELASLKQEAIALADLDSAAFEKIMNAYRLGKETEAERRKREEAILLSTKEETEIPLATARLGLKALETALPMLSHAVKSAFSDFGVGTLLLAAGIKGAVLNVKTNLVGFSDAGFKEACLEECERIVVSAEKMTSEIQDLLNKAFN